MDDVDDMDRAKLDTFLQSIRDSREETRRHGLVSPEDVERGTTDAIARGLRQREDEAHAGGDAKRR